MVSFDNRKRIPKLSIVPKFQNNYTDSPPSPTESHFSFISSISGIAEKSASELGSLLKSAYSTIKEKEKNLVLAAEIGKSLLEHNKILKSEYDQLLQAIQNCQVQSTPSVNSSWREEQEELNVSRLMSTKKAYESIIDSLEKKNLELEEALDEAKNKLKTDEQTSLQKQRKLNAEIEILKGNLDIAAQKVQELEEKFQSQQIRAKQLETKRELEQTQNQDILLLEELKEKMEELFIENKHLYYSKKAVEEKLVQSLRDLDRLQHEFLNFELTQHNYDALQDTFEAQKAHIQELTHTLEDHQSILSRLRDKGVWSHSAAQSTAGHSSSGRSLSSTHKNSLLGELEHAWLRKNSKDGLPKSQSESNLPSLLLSTNHLMSDHASPSSLSDDDVYSIQSIRSTLKALDNRSLLDEADFLKFQSNSPLFEPEFKDEVYADYNLYPTQIRSSKPQIVLRRRGLIEHIQFQIRYLIRSLFKWCRFTIVLTAAVFINLWKSPDFLIKK